MRFASILVAALAFATPSPADQAAIDRGEQLVEQWCRDCHLRKFDPPDDNMAPSYEEIVLRPGRDRAYLKKYLADDHFPMTTYRLFKEEKADVLEWLMSLKPKGVK